MESDPEEPPLGAAVHREVENGALHRAVHYPLDLAGGLLQNEHVVGADEGHADRLVEAGDGRTHGQIRVDHTRGRIRAPR
jgi:hypothetical protein